MINKHEIVKLCLNCNNPINTDLIHNQLESNLSKRKYCCYKCHYEHRFPKTITKCKQCGNDFVQGLKNKYQRVFCSFNCSRKYLSGERNGMYGKKRSEEWKNNQSKRFIGKIRRPLSKEINQKISLQAKERWSKQEFKDKMKPILDRIHKNKERNKKISLNNQGKERTIETRIKQSANKQGIDIKEWKNFISKEPYDGNWCIKLKNRVRNRDNQVCMNCGIHREKYNKSFDVHHINYDKKLSIPQNCISLCNKCHTLTNINREYWQKLFQEKLSKLYNYNYSENGKIILEVIQNGS